MSGACEITLAEGAGVTWEEGEGSEFVTVSVRNLRRNFVSASSSR